jgi:phosphate transport system substrate-binding protein
LKKIIAVLLAVCATVLTGCGGAGFDADRAISVVSREDGSGTRGAFIELFGIEYKGADGTRRDMTTKETITAMRTDIMLTNITGDRYAIGYVSLGSMNASVKAVAVDGVQATPETVKNGTYVVTRPFLIATKGAPSGVAADFIAFILSAEGQTIAADTYIAADDNAAPYTGGGTSGRIVIVGSSSVTPLMEKLREGYIAVNPSAVIEIQQSDSSSGMAAAINGTCDIGMSSRELKDGELAQLTPIRIALDGIVLAVNNANPIENLTREQVRAIFTGETVTWSDII